jgi:hypothetical protein
MAYTYSKLATVTVGSGGSSSIDFIAIPQNYTDLIIQHSLRTTLSGGPFYFDDCAMRINDDVGNNYSRLFLRTRSGTVSSSSNSPTSFIQFYEASAGDSTANTFGSGQIYIPNYAGSNHKSISIEGASETNSSEVQNGFTAGLWHSASAITSLKLYSQNSVNFVQYSTATLYGIKAEV